MYSFYRKLTNNANLKNYVFINEQKASESHVALDKVE
jgi:hypothetical protein